MKSLRNVSDEPLSMNVFNSGATDRERTTSGLDGRFVHSQLLIDCLLRMQPSPTDKDEFISLCKQEHAENKEELGIINEFEQTYSSDRSIWWYTRETFLYRLLNKGLRAENIDLLFYLFDLVWQILSVSHLDNYLI